MSFKFELKEAVKEAVPPLIGLWGVSGSGKTYSALLLARGIVGPEGKIAVIDTENGRARFYAEVAGPWQHLDLQPPFSPEKYSAAFKCCEDAGADIIIVDSVSHVWEGEGGVLDAAEKIGGNGLFKWKAPKTAHKRMVNNLMRSPIPVIFCIREKELIVQKGRGKQAEMVSLGPVPIAEKNFIFEMTVALRMTKNGGYDMDLSKAPPEELRDVIVPDGIVTVEMGQKLAEWAGSGEEVDDAVRALKRDGADAALQGVDAYTKWLKKLKKDQKASIKNMHADWSKTAKDFDAQTDDGIEEEMGGV